MAFKKSENAEVTYKVIEKCGVISTSKNNTLEVRLISWNGREPKYDIRQWYIKEDGTEGMGKGLTLTGEQMESLYTTLEKIKNA